MKIKLEDRQIIKAATSLLSTKEDLLALLNYSKKLLYGENAIAFELKQLTWYSNPTINQKRYTIFQINKKTGGKRVLHAPVKGLKHLQSCLNLILSSVFEAHPAAMGFVSGRSIVDNAAVHVKSKYVYNIDLKDFFHSIEQARVWKCLQLRPFSLGQNEEALKKNAVEISALLGYGISPTTSGRKYEVVNIIAALCCTELFVERLKANDETEIVLRKVLPQGAPTSPVITNIVCQRLDHLLTGVAKRFGLRYTRYADDITFSSMHSVYPQDHPFQKEVQRIITEQGFQIKISKTRLQHGAYRQEVTGLIVNQRVNVHTGYIKQLRMWLYYWENYGYDKAEQLFTKDRLLHLGANDTETSPMVPVMLGKLQYLKMVRGAEDALYQKLITRFRHLLESSTLRDRLLNEVLNILLSKGIDEAMHIYHPLKISPNGR